MNLAKRCLPALLLLTAGVTLAAAEPRWGVQAALSLPGGDLPDGASTGLQVGGHGRWAFGGGHGLMGRADLTQYGQRHGFSSSSLGVAADYTYHLQGTRTGLYLLGGVSLLDYRWTLEGQDSRSNTALGLDLGVGYDLNRNLGLQARFTTHEVSGSSLTALNLGVTYIF